MPLAPVFLGSAAFVFLNFMLPIYTRQLGADAIDIGGMYTAFVLSMVLFRPLVGWALDRFGRRMFFCSAFVFYAIAMLVFAGADSLGDFFLARALQGIGASLMWVSARTIVVDLTADGGRGRQMGRLTSRSVQGAMLGATYGFTLLGMMPLPAAWQAAFVGYAVAAVAGLLVSLARVTETARESRGAGESGSPPVLTGSRAVLTPQAVITPPLRRLFVIAALSGFATALIEPIYLIYLLDKFGLSVQALAFAFFPAGIVFAVLPNYTGRWVDRFGRVRLMLAGLGVAALVNLGLPWMPGIIMVAVCYTFAAVARSLSLPAEDALAGDLAEAPSRGRVMGLREAASGVGAAVGPPAGGWIYETLAPELAFVANGVMLIAALLLVRLWFDPGRETVST